MFYICPEANLGKSMWADYENIEESVPLWQ